MVKSKKRIIFVFHSENIFNGATRSLSNIVDYLIDIDKYNIEMIFPKKEGSAIDYYKKKGIKIYYYKYGGLIQDLTQLKIRQIIRIPLLFVRYFNIKKEAKKAYSELNITKDDIVYTNTSTILFGGFLSKLANSKSLWHIREYRIKDHRINFFLGDNYIKKFINEHSDGVMFVSRSVQDYNTDIIDEKKCTVTYNSYSKDFICPKDKFVEKGKTINVLIAGDIKPSKGQLDVVKAVKMCNKINNNSFILHIAGRASNKKYYNEILQYVSDSNMIDSVKLYGHVSDMKELRKSMDIGVVASTNEAFGRTTIEGMLSMMAMIGSNTGGTGEQIIDGETGLLYDTSVEDLRDKLLLLYNDNELLKKCALNGFSNSVDNFTNNQCAKIVENVIDSV